jgi:hypothetical protein
LNIRHTLSLLSGLAYAVSASFYVFHVAKGKIKPNIGSFLIWSFTNASLLVSLIAAHVWNSVPFAAVATINTVTVCILSLRYKRFYFSKIDAVGTVLGIFGVIVWLLTRQAQWNIYVVAVINTITFAPLVTKTIKFPHYETKLPWYFNFLGAVLLIASTPYFTFVQLVIPLQQFLSSFSINAALLYPRPKKIKIS